jgi:hypothetical protein
MNPVKAQICLFNLTEEREAIRIHVDPPIRGQLFEYLRSPIWDKVNRMMITLRLVLHNG